MNNELLTESHLPSANTVFCWSVSGTFGVGRESQIAIRAMSSQLKMLLVVPDQVASQMPQGHEGYLAKVHSHDRTHVAGCLPWARGVPPGERLAAFTPEHGLRDRKSQLRVCHQHHDPRDRR